MVWATYIFIYLGAIVFLIGCVRRVLQYSRLPRHLRWELYPVPHEDPRHAAHGGSYFEDLDWWKHPRRRNLRGELAFMIPEMVFLKGLREFNRKLWSFSFPFHFGMYLCAASGVMVGVTALISIRSPFWMAGSFGFAIHAFSKYAAIVGGLLVIFGSLSLLVRRLTDPDLKTYTVPADLFNLLSFSVIAGLLLAGYLTAGPAFPGITPLARGLLTAHPVSQLPPLLAIGLVLLMGWMAYIPYTHMAHFISKFFAYHDVRWDDATKEQTGNLQKQIAEYLAYRPTWAASHIGADGEKTWVDIAVSQPTGRTK